MKQDDILPLLRERIVSFAASRLARDVAEDLAQEVLILIHEKYANLDRIEDLLPLSLQIVRFKMMGARRKSIRHGEYSQVSVDDIPLRSNAEDPSQIAERKQRVDQLRAAMNQLGERCRGLLRLKLEGKTFPEIQKVLQVGSINTLYTWDSRCRKQLLELMGGDWEGGK